MDSPVCSIKQERVKLLRNHKGGIKMKNVRMFLAVAVMSFIALSANVFASGGTYISSYTNITGGKPALFLRSRESLRYSVADGATGYWQLEWSDDGSNWTTRNLNISSGNIHGAPLGVSVAVTSGTTYTDVDKFYRVNVTSITAGFFTIVLEDRDDFVDELKNKKKIPIVTYNDDSVVIDGVISGTTVTANTVQAGKLTLQPSATGQSTISMAANVTLTQLTANRTYSILTSTEGAISMTAIPNISTASAQPGDVMILRSVTDYVQINSSATQANSGFIGGTTDYRRLGVGDILGMIYDGAGFWRELFFTNKQ